MSDDGETAIVVIAMLGHPFSPDYARARERAHVDGGRSPDALKYCAMNVAVYGKAATSFALHERAISEQSRAEAGVAIGESSMAWEGDKLVVDLDERTTPFGRPVKGRIVVSPEVLSGLELPLDEDGAHLWWPVAPLARIDVNLEAPSLRFTGHGYHDANAGAVPLDETFESWSWSRARTDAGALLTYDVACSSGATSALAFRVASNGDVESLPRTWPAPLPRTSWRIDRHVRVDEGEPAHVVRSLEDGPFYARALVASRMGGAQAVAMHETLAVHRLRRRWVRFLAGFRMRSG